MENINAVTYKFMKLDFYIQGFVLLSKNSYSICLSSRSWNMSWWKKQGDVIVNPLHMEVIFFFSWLLFHAEKLLLNRYSYPRSCICFHVAYCFFVELHLNLIRLKKDNPDIIETISCTCRKTHLLSVNFDFL